MADFAIKMDDLNREELNLETSLYGNKLID